MFVHKIKNANQNDINSYMDRTEYQFKINIRIKQATVRYRELEEIIKTRTKCVCGSNNL